MKSGKTTSAAALLCVLAVFVSLFTGCTQSAAEDGNDLKSKAVISAQIISASKDSLLVTADSGLYVVALKENTPVTQDGNNVDKGKLMPGMKVQIGFGGEVLETYPAQIPNTEAIKIISQDDDNVALYLEAAKHIFEERAGKDFEKSEISTVALDVTKLSTLSKNEKNALEYVLRNYFYTETGADVIRSSYEELSSGGRLTKEGEFKNGVIISLAASEGKKTFSLSLTHSGLGGYGYESCTAKRKNGAWQISYDDAWIS